MDSSLLASSSNVLLLQTGSESRCQASYSADDSNDIILNSNLVRSRIYACFSFMFEYLSKLPNLRQHNLYSKTKNRLVDLAWNGKLCIEKVAAKAQNLLKSNYKASDRCMLWSEMGKSQRILETRIL